MSTRLVRGRSSGAVHLATCRYAVNMTPWEWAEGRPDEQWLVKGWLRPCRTCLPEQAALQKRLKLRAEASS